MIATSTERSQLSQGISFAHEKRTVYLLVIILSWRTMLWMVTQNCLSVCVTMFSHLGLGWVDYKGGCSYPYFSRLRKCYVLFMWSLCNPVGYVFFSACQVGWKSRPNRRTVTKIENRGQMTEMTENTIVDPKVMTNTKGAPIIMTYLLSKWGWLWALYHKDSSVTQGTRLPVVPSSIGKNYGHF